MDEFQGSFVSFINKPKVTIRPQIPKPEVIDIDDEMDEDSSEKTAETESYEVVAEVDTEAAESVPKKVVETPEMIYNRLHTELEQLAQACQDDFLYQITNDEYLSLSSAESTYLNQLNKLIFGWCSKNLRIFRVCQECDYKVAQAREMNRHLAQSEACNGFYYALGTFDAPANLMQCQCCNYSSNSQFNMRRHQQNKGHTGIEFPGIPAGSSSGGSSSSGGGQQQQPQQNEWLPACASVGLSEVVQLDEDGEVVETVQAQQVQEPVPDQTMADISQWPKDDDPAGHISNLQSQLEQRVESSSDHFIFRISDDEYAALCEQRTRHMAKFRELVDIYCGKTLKLYRVCEGCGFATFMRRDMVQHFKIGTCALRFFNALGTCDDDDPNREVDEEEEAEEVAVNNDNVTEVTPEVNAVVSNEGLKVEVPSDVEEYEPNVDQIMEVTPKADEVTSNEVLKIEIACEANEAALNDDQLTEVTPETDEIVSNVSLKVEVTTDATPVTDEISSNDVLKMEVPYESNEVDQITEVTPEMNEVTSNEVLKVEATSEVEEVEDHTTEVTCEASELMSNEVMEVMLNEESVVPNENHTTDVTPEANEDVSNHAEITKVTDTGVVSTNRKRKSVMKNKPTIGESEDRYQCPLCKSEMAIINKYNHFRRYCPGKFGHKKPCYHCQMLFDNWRDVKRHIRDVHNPNYQVPPPPKIVPPKIVVPKKPPKPKKTENRYQCPLCNRDMDKASEYNHIRRSCPAKFGNKKPCYHCPMIFDSIKEVRQHIKAEHNVRGYSRERKCQECGKQFKRLSDLQMHCRDGCSTLEIGETPSIPIKTSLKASPKVQCKDCLALFLVPDLARHQQNFCKKIPLNVPVLPEVEPVAPPPKPVRPVRTSRSKKVKPTPVMVMGPLEFIQCNRCQIYCVSRLELARHKAKFCRRGQQHGTVPLTEKFFLCKDCLVKCATEEELERHRREDCKDAAPLVSVVKVEETVLDGDVGRHVEEEKT